MDTIRDYKLVGVLICDDHGYSLYSDIRNAERDELRQHSRMTNQFTNLLSHQPFTTYCISLVHEPGRDLSRASFPHGLNISDESWPVQGLRSDLTRTNELVEAVSFCEDAMNLRFQGELAPWRSDRGTESISDHSFFLVISAILMS